jgi:hypothetical protein
MEKKDHIAVAMADFEAMSQSDRGELLARVMEDQAILMGFLTNLADDFNAAEHQALVDSVLILINAFVSAGIPVQPVSNTTLQEVLEEKEELRDNVAPEDLLNPISIVEASDSPLVFEDLRNRALSQSDLHHVSPQERQNFLFVLEALLTMIERTAAVSIKERDER